MLDCDPQPERMCTTELAQLRHGRVSRSSNGR